MMNISPQIEHMLVDLADRGLWLQVDEDRLQVIATRDDAAALTDELRHQIASQRGELLNVIPTLDSERLELVGPIVRILYARMNPSERERIENDLRVHGTGRALKDWIYDNYRTLPRAIKTVYLWRYVYSAFLEPLQLQEVA